ncbi:antichymotrypsin-2-like isoform X6 [Atheta coriaria]|uniref:antichymotrypsin-2-like isoform X6 n=1 Tax=Dalotia coriaria TaxID=877792 RepID=UPI0031F40CF9
MPITPVISSIARRSFGANTSPSFSLSSASCILFLGIFAISSTMANDNAKAVVAGNNRITGQLYQHIAEDNENLIFSPLSVHTVLSLVYQGAAGSTEAAFKNVLGVPDKLKTAEGYQSVMAQLNNVANVTLEIANQVYVKNGYRMKPQFKEVATKQFAAGAENIEFTAPTAAKTMNTWVEQRTKDKIKDLIKQEDLDADTRMVLINAVYFKGNWADQFNKDLTRPDKFFISETETVPCQMMFRNGKYRYKDDSALDAQVIELPYKNPALSMIVILPKSKTGIKELEKKLAKLDLATVTKDMYSVEVDLSLPKFKIESTIQLNEPLQKLGLGEAFSGAANFSDLLESSEPLKISKVVQKAFIEVNEEGAEAAAATGVVMMMRCMPVKLPKIAFRAEHPFVFYLMHLDNEHQALFHGKLDSTATDV